MNFLIKVFCIELIIFLVVNFSFLNLYEKDLQARQTISTFVLANFGYLFLANTLLKSWFEEDSLVISITILFAILLAAIPLLSTFL
jgi:hypothetical protein